MDFYCPQCRNPIMPIGWHGISILSTAATTLSCGRAPFWTPTAALAYIPPMSERIRLRQIVALVAAYLVALQALLLPLSVAAGISFDSRLCAAASTADAPQPAGGHNNACPCAAGCGMQSCAQALIEPPPGIIVFGQEQGRTYSSGPITASIARPAANGPQIPRAPPV